MFDEKPGVEPFVPMGRRNGAAKYLNTGQVGKQAFLSNAVTLLKSLKNFITGDKVLVMALNEDDMAPFYDLYSDR